MPTDECGGFIGWEVGFGSPLLAEMYLIPRVISLHFACIPFSAAVVILPEDPQLSDQPGATRHLVGLHRFELWTIRL